MKRSGGPREPAAAWCDSTSCRTRSCMRSLGTSRNAALIRRNETKVRLPSPNNARKPGPTQLTHLRVRRRAQERITGNFGKTLRGCLERFGHPPDPNDVSAPFIREALDGTSFALSVVGDREG